MRDLRLRLGVTIAFGVGLILLLNQRSASQTAPAGLPRFEDVAAAAGVNFSHYDSSTPAQYMPERMGSGLGWIDYDNDGWPDLFCVQDGSVRVPPSPLRGRGGKNQPTSCTATTATGLLLTSPSRSGSPTPGSAWAAPSATTTTTASTTSW